MKEKSKMKSKPKLKSKVKHDFKKVSFRIIGMTPLLLRKYPEGSRIRPSGCKTDIPYG